MAWNSGCDGLFAFSMKQHWPLSCTVSQRCQPWDTSLQRATFLKVLGLALIVCCLAKLCWLATTTQLLTDGLFSWTCQFVPPVNIVLHQTTCLQISVGFKLNDRLTFWVVSHHSIVVSIINIVGIVQKSRIEKKYFSLPMAMLIISILIKWIWTT